MSQELLSASTLKEGQEKLLAAVEQLDKILLGQHELHKLVIIGILSRGHILLEGLPGVGKTALVKALGNILSLQFSRIQFTPDLLPGDITGGNILQTAPAGTGFHQHSPCRRDQSGLPQDPVRHA